MSQLDDMGIYDALHTIEYYHPGYLNNHLASQPLEKLYGENKDLDKALDKIFQLRIKNNYIPRFSRDTSSPEDDALVDKIIDLAGKGYSLHRIAEKLGVSAVYLNSMRWRYMAVDKALAPLSKPKVPDEVIKKRLLQVLKDPSKTTTELYRSVHIQRARFMRLVMQNDDVYDAYQHYKVSREAWKYKQKRVRERHKRWERKQREKRG